VVCVCVQKPLLTYLCSLVSILSEESQSDTVSTTIVFALCYGYFRFEFFLTHLISLRFPFFTRSAAARIRSLTLHSRCAAQPFGPGFCLKHLIWIVCWLMTRPRNLPQPLRPPRDLARRQLVWDGEEDADGEEVAECGDRI